MEIKRTGSRPSGKGPTEYFIGTVRRCGATSNTNQQTGDCHHALLQIRDSRRTCKFLLVTGLALIALVGCSSSKDTSAPPPPTVEVASVIQLDVPIYSEWVATLDGHVNAQIQPRVSGYIVSLGGTTRPRCGRRPGGSLPPGITKEVTFESADGAINDRIDEAYQAKYRGSPYLSPMIGARARSATKCLIVNELIPCRGRQTHLRGS